VLAWPLISWAVSLASQQNASICSTVLAYAVLLFSLGALPVLLGFTAYRLRDSRWLARWTITPCPTAWDNFFARRETCWMIFHLKDGRKMAGHYTAGSHASMFPNGEDIYVSELESLKSSFRVGTR
jgi:hypothetical protein